MELYYYVIFAFFAVISYMMIVDKNVIIFIDLIFRYIGVQFKRAFWIIRFHPINPIPRWTLNWRISRITAQLEKDMGIKRGLTDKDDHSTM